MESGIYPESTISSKKIGMLLIGLKDEKMDAGLYSFRFYAQISSRVEFWEKKR